MGILKGFPKSVGRVGSRLHGFPCFPYSVISMACFSPGRSWIYSYIDQRNAPYLRSAACIRSCTIPSFIQPSESFDKLINPVRAKGAPNAAAQNKTRGGEEQCGGFTRGSGHGLDDEYEGSGCVNSIEAFRIQVSKSRRRGAPRLVVSAR